MWLSGHADELNWQPGNTETESTSYFETIQTIETEITDTHETPIDMGAADSGEIETLAQADMHADTEAEPNIQTDEPPDSGPDIQPDTRNRRVLSIQEMRSKLGVALDGPPPRPALDLSSRPRIIRRRDDAACDAGFGMAMA